MADFMDSDYISRLVKIYNRNPNLLTPEQKRQAMDLIAKLPKQETFSSPSRIANQLFSGFLSGFSALGNYADQPRNTWEAIANSIGHLSGFIGMVWPGKAVGTAIGKGVGALRGALSTKVGMQALEKSAIAAGSMDYLQTRFRSVPMMFADLVEKGTRVSGIQAQVGAFLAGRPIAKQALASGGHLGAAMFASSLHSGMSEALKGGMYGLVAGGFLDAGLGNIPGLAGEAVPHRVMRSLAGALSQSAAPLMQGENPFKQPPEMLVYDMLLGSYFGWHALTNKSWQAMRFMREKSPTELLGYASTPEYHNLDPETRVILRKKITEYLKPMEVRQALIDVMEGIKRGSTAHQAFTPEIGARVRIDGEDSQKIHEIKSIDPENDSVTLSDGRTVEMDYLVDATRPIPTMAQVWTEATSADKIHDFDAFAKASEDPLGKFIRSNARDESGAKIVPELSPSEFWQHERNFRGAVERILKDKEKFGAEYDDWQAFKATAEQFVQARLRPLNEEGRPKFPMKDEEFNDIRDWYVDQVYAKPVEYSHYDYHAGAVGKDIPNPDRNVVFNLQGDRFPYRATPPMFSRVRTSEGELPYGVINSVYYRGKKTKDGSTVIGLIQADLNDRHFGKIINSLDAQGRSLLGGSSEKEQLHYAGYAPEKDLLPVGEEFAAWLESQGKGDAFKEMVTEVAKRTRVSPKVIEKQLLNNVFIWKNLNNNLPLAKILSEDSGSWVRSVNAFNKRFQIMTQKYPPIHPFTLPKERIGTNFKVIYAHDPNGEYDGAVWMSGRATDDLAYATGLPKGKIASLKFFHHDITPNGAQLWKLAAHLPTGKYAAAIEATGADMIVFDSAAKQYGDRAIYNLVYSPEGRISFHRGPGEAVSDPVRYEVAPDRLFVSRDTFDDSAKIMPNGREKLYQKKTLAQQSASRISDMTAMKDYSDFKIGISKGTEEGNALFQEYLKTGNLEVLTKDRDIYDDIDKQMLIDRLQQDMALRDDFIRWLSGQPENADEVLEDMITSEEYLSQENVKTDVKRLLEAHSSARGMTLQKFGADQVNKDLIRFFHRSLERPKIRHSGSARLVPIDPHMKQTYGIDDTNFMLGPNWRKLPVMGVDADGKSKEITLGKAYAEYEKLLKKKDLSALDKTRLEAYEDLMEIVVARVPIDDPSGLIPLKFKGFIEGQGGGLYVTKRNMNFLGGADFDIDSAFFYQGLPKSYRKFLKSQRGNFDLFREEMTRGALVRPAKGIEPSEQFFEPSKEKLWMNETFSMFEPFHLMKVNKATSIGRGQNLGRSISYTRRLDSLIGRLKAQKIAPGVLVTIDGSPFVVSLAERDTLYRALSSGVVGASADAAAGGVLKTRVPVDWVDQRMFLLMSAFPDMVVNGRRIWGPQDIRRVQDPEIPGFMRLARFGNAVQEAQAQIIAGREINLTDKEGRITREYRSPSGVPLQAELKMQTLKGGSKDQLEPVAVLKAPKGEILEFDPESRQPVRKYYLRGQDLEKAGLKIGNHKFDMSFFKYFEGIKTFDSIPYMGAFMDLQSKMFRRNEWENRGWEMDEAANSAWRFTQEKAYHDPVFYTAERMMGMRLEDSITTNLQATMRVKDLLHLENMLLNEHPELGRFLGADVKFSVNSLNKLAKAVLANYENVNTELGRMRLAKDEKAFLNFIRAEQASKITKKDVVLDKPLSTIPVEEYLAYLATRKEKGQKRFELRKSPRREQADDYTVKKRMEFIKDTKERVNDYYSERFATLASLKGAIDIAYQMDVPQTNVRKALTTPYPTGLTNKKTGVPMEESVLGALMKIKRYYRNNRSPKSPIVTEGESTESENVVDLVRIGQELAAFSANQNKIEPALMREMFDLLLLSPFNAIAKDDAGVKYFGPTGEVKLGLKFAGDPAVERFVRNYEEVYGNVKGGAEKSKLKQFFRLEEAKAQADVEAVIPKRIYERTHWAKRPDIQISPEVAHLRDQILEYVTRNPNHPFYGKPDELFKFIRGVMGIAQPSDMTIFELKGLANLMREIDYGPTLMNRFLAMTPADRNKKFGWLETTKFPATLSKEDYFRGFEIIEERLLTPTRELAPEAVPKRHINPFSGRLELVFAEAAYPLSTLERLVRTQNYKQQRINLEQTRVFAKLKTKFEPLTRAVNHGTKSKEDGLLLFAYATAEKEWEKYRMMSPSNIQLLLPKERDHVQRLREFRMNWMAQHGKLLTDSFTLYMGKQKAEETKKETEAGKARNLFGQTLVDKAVQDITELQNDRQMDDKWIVEHLKLDQERGVVDIEATLNSFRKLLEINPESVDVPADFSFLTEYLTEIQRIAEDETFHKVEIGRDTSDFMRKVRNFDVPFLVEFKEEAKKFKILGMYPDEMKKWLATDARALSEGQITDRDRHFISSLNKYYSTFIHPSDYRFPLFPQDPSKAPDDPRNDRSQFNDDLLLASGALDEKGRPVMDEHKYTLRYWQNKKPWYPTTLEQGYWHHTMFDRNIVGEWVAGRKKALLYAAEKNELGREQVEEGLRRLVDIYNGVVKVDVPYGDEVAEDIADSFIVEGGKRFIKLDTVASFKPRSAMRRTEYLSGYSRNLNALAEYLTGNITSKWNSLAATLSWKSLRDWHREAIRSGRLTQEQADGFKRWYTMYLRNAMELPSLFTKEELDDKFLEIKKTPYYYLSDHAALVSNTYANKMLRKLLGANRVTNGERIVWNLDTPAKEKSYLNEKVRRLTTLSPGAKSGNFTPQDIYNMKVGARMLKGFSQLEARYEMAALLASLKTAVANLGGGNINTVVWNGVNAFKQARSIDKWKEINPDFGTMKDVARWVEELGVVHDVVLQDAQLRQELSDPQKRGFVEEAFMKIRKDPEFSDENLLEIAKRHGLEKKFLDTSGFFMRKTERMNRVTAFLSGYMAGRRMYKDLPLDLNTPYLIEMGRKSIEMTQFLYDSANRPAFAATNLGHVYSRFKLWTWSSARFQREIFNEVAKAGFAPNSPESERLQRLAVSNLFMLTLASLLPYTMFDSMLPGPLGILQNLADWLFGDDQARERAFFGQGSIIFKGWLAPVNELLPPVSRLPAALEQGFNYLLDPEIELQQQYILWASVPFGRMSRDVVRSLNNPAMAVDFMTGIPLHRFQRLAQAAEKEKKNTP